VTGGTSTGLNVTYGIDFTKSNGRRKNPNSLHYLSKKYRQLVEDGCENENHEKMISSYNVYQRSIHLIGKILEEVFSSPAASSVSAAADNNRSDSEKKRSSVVPLGYSVYGFGAAVGSLQDDVSDCFSLHPQVASLPTLLDVLRVRILLFSFSFFISSLSSLSSCSSLPSLSFFLSFFSVLSIIYEEINLCWTNKLS
jgi:hypothetical protein